MKKSFFSSISSFVRERILKPVNKLVSAPTEGASKRAMPSHRLTDPIPEKDVITRYELAMSARKIVVHCGSCGVRHELDAVCARCGKPLCRDESNCRFSFYDSRLEKKIIVCENCK